MSEETATATTAPTTTTTDAPAPEATVTATPDGLKVAIGEYQAHRDRVMGKPPTKTEPVAEEKPEKPADEPATKPAEAATAAAPAPATEPAPPATPPQDEVSESMSKLLRQQRALSRRQRELDAQAEATKAEREAHAAAIAAAEKFEAARKQDPVKAVEELLGDEVMQGSFPVDLLTRLSQKAGDVPATPEQLAEAAAERAAALVQAKLAEAQAAKEAEAAKAQAEEQKAAQARREANRDAFFEGLAVQLVADAAKYPYLLADPVDWPVVDAYVQGEFAKTGIAPAPEAILKHFDAQNEAKAKRFVDVYSKRAPQPTPAPTGKESPTAVVAKDAGRDARGRTETPIDRKESPSQKIERIARELNGH
jgi:hypothetical protein